MTLNLTIKKKWFDMIRSGEKQEEYRELNMYWAKRLTYKITSPHGGHLWDVNAILLGESETAWKNFTGGAPRFNEYSHVLFANGGHFGNVPKIIRDCYGIEIREGRPEWGAEIGKKYFVIKLKP